MNKKELGVWLESLGFVREVRFRGMSGKRRFAWDWSHPSGVVVEYQGKGVGHQSFKAVERDYEKTTEGQLCGHLVIQCSAPSTGDGRCQKWVEEALKQRGRARKV